MSRRTEKVSSLLMRYVAEILATLELPAMTTVSEVNVSPDLKQALVGITVIPEEKEQEVLRILDGHLLRIQVIINKKLAIKNIPQVKFVLDKARQYAQRIDELIRKTREDV